MCWRCWWIFLCIWKKTVCIYRFVCKCRSIFNNEIVETCQLVLIQITKIFIQTVNDIVVSKTFMGCIFSAINAKVLLFCRVFFVSLVVITRTNNYRFPISSNIWCSKTFFFFRKGLLMIFWFWFLQLLIAKRRNFFALLYIKRISSWHTIPI